MFGAANDVVCGLAQPIIQSGDPWVRRHLHIQTIEGLDCVEYSKPTIEQSDASVCDCVLLVIGACIPNLGTMHKTYLVVYNV